MSPKKFQFQFVCFRPNDIDPTTLLQYTMLVLHTFKTTTNTDLMKTMQSKRLFIHLFVLIEMHCLCSLVCTSLCARSQNCKAHVHSCVKARDRFTRCFPSVDLPLTWADSSVIFPKVPEGVDKRRRLLPNNSSRPPTRIQAATLKRNKKATWHTPSTFSGVVTGFQCSACSL